MPKIGYKQTKEHRKKIGKAKEGKNHPNYIDGRCANIKEYKKRHRQENKEKYIERDRIYCQEHKKEKRESDKKYRLEHKEEFKKWNRKYARTRSQKDFSFRFNKNIRTAIWFALKHNKAGRHWEDLVGYTLQDLVKHLESLFKPWMNLDNWGRVEIGKKKWNIDHIKPQSLFKYKTAEDLGFKECWALENLQPLEAVANVRKFNHY